MARNGNGYPSPARRVHAAVVIAGLLACAAFTAAAQVPGPLVPGRQRDPLPQPPKSEMPSPVTPPTLRQPAPEGSESVTLTLHAIHVTGATVFSERELLSIWQPYLETKITVDKLYAFASQITQRYAKAGYTLSFALVPEQKIDGGVVTLRVVEGFVGKIAFTGDTAKAGKGWFKNGRPVERHLKAAVYNILASRPLKNRDLERYLLLINDIPGMTAEATFAASGDVEGASDMTIRITRKRLRAQLSADNTLSRTLNSWNAGVSVGVAGVLTPTDLLQFEQRCGAFCDVYHQTSLSWSTFLGTDGWKLALSASHSKEKPVRGLLVPLDFRGENTSFGADLSYLLIRSRQVNLSVGTNAGWIDNKTDIFAGRLTQDSVRTAGFYTSGDIADATGAITSGRVSMTKGLPFFDATETGDPLKSRADGSSNFLLASAYGSRIQPLEFLSPALSRFSIFLSGNGQATLNRPLLSASQCYYGGNEFGRGYESGSISGDSCLMGSVELRRDFAIGSWGLQAYGFGDAGMVWRKGALAPGESSKSGAQSAGGGMRFLPGYGLEGDLVLAWPLEDTYSYNGKGAPRTLMTIYWKY